MAIALAERPRRLERIAVWCKLICAWAALVVVSPVAEATSPAAPSAFEPVYRTAAWPSWLRGGRPLFDRAPTPTVPDTPHPAVARIIVPEGGATAFGSGTLVDVRDQFGLVITNWHVVRDSQGTVEVVFPSGFRSHARPLKVDSDWDLAALVIWRPQIEPVRVSQIPPLPGDPLTIHGYGQGAYRIATGRCTAYYAPKLNFPREMVELDVEARQGDSGGPIFNQSGELAGVLFGAGQGTTIGSFAPRVESFLASLAPDIGTVHDQTEVAVSDRPAPEMHRIDEPANEDDAIANGSSPAARQVAAWPSSPWNGSSEKQKKEATARVADNGAPHGLWFNRIKSVLAIVGIVAVALQLVRVAK